MTNPITFSSPTHRIYAVSKSGKQKIWHAISGFGRTVTATASAIDLIACHSMALRS
ncbi:MULTISPECIES: hypothetical protein [unclassified Bradyrhizobium]